MSDGGNDSDGPTHPIRRTQPDAPNRQPASPALVIPSKARDLGLCRQRPRCKPVAQVPSAAQGRLFGHPPLTTRDVTKDEAYSTRGKMFSGASELFA